MLPRIDLLRSVQKHNEDFFRSEVQVLKNKLIKLGVELSKKKELEIVYENIRNVLRGL